MQSGPNASIRTSAIAVIIFVAALGACDNPPTGPGVDPPELTLTGPARMAPGELAEYRVVTAARGVSGPSRDVSTQAQWRSSAEGVVAIADRGRATAQQPGEAIITASYQGRTATLSVLVLPDGTFALKGTVADALTNAPVAGALVQVLSGDRVVLESTTGTDGQFQLYGFVAGSAVRVSKEGYLVNYRAVAPHTVPLDVRLTKLANGDQYSGAYTLTLETGGQCSIPESARIRTYTAVIEPYARPNSSANYLVTLSDATFASGCGTNRLAPGLGCNQFLASKNGGSISFSMMDLDWGEGGQISEQLADGTWITIVGNAPGRFEGSVLQAFGTAQSFYCAVPQASPWFCANRFCQSDDFRLSFARRD
jgi:hypothetical protein